MELLTHVGRVVDSIVSLLAVAEVKALTPKLAHLLRRGAVVLLPAHERERYAEEWASHLNEIPNSIGMLLCAMSFYMAAFRIPRATSAVILLQDISNARRVVTTHTATLVQRAQAKLMWFLWTAYILSTWRFQSSDAKLKLALVTIIVVIFGRK